MFLEVWQAKGLWTHFSDQDYILDKSKRNLQCRREPPESPMTIGIGVLSSSNPRPHPIRPDSVTLIADTMGSTDTDSTSELHKLYVEDGIYAVCAGKVEFASEVISIFQQELKSLEKRNFGGIWHSLNVAVHEHRRSHFHWDCLVPKYAFQDGTLLESQQQNVIQDWQQYDSGIEMLVSVFHPNGSPLLFLVGPVDGNGGWVHPCQYPGYWAIGSGARNAISWLNYRQQQLGLRPLQSTYHAYEAKLMSSMAPTVNKNTEIAVAFADREYVLRADRPEVEGCPVSLPELTELYKKYGPQNTNALGHVVKRILKK